MYSIIFLPFAGGSFLDFVLNSATQDKNCQSKLSPINKTKLERTSIQCCYKLWLNINLTSSCSIQLKLAPSRAQVCQAASSSSEALLRPDSPGSPIVTAEFCFKKLIPLKL